MEKAFSSKEDENSDGNENSGYVSLWSLEATTKLVHLLKANYEGFMTKERRKISYYADFARELQEVKPGVTALQVEKKWSNMMRQLKRYIFNMKTNSGKRIKKPDNYDVLMTFVEEDPELDITPSHLSGLASSGLPITSKRKAAQNHSFIKQESPTTSGYGRKRSSIYDIFNDEYEIYEDDEELVLSDDMNEYNNGTKFKRKKVKTDFNNLNQTLTSLNKILKIGVKEKMRSNNALEQLVQIELAKLEELKAIRQLKKEKITIIPE